jgi:hypothetical protein
MKLNEKKLADVCANHGWAVQPGEYRTEVSSSGALIKLTRDGTILDIESASGPFGAVNDMLQVIETCIEES